MKLINMNTNLLPSELMRKGGMWLGVLRGKIQTMFQNGNDLTWGSNDKPSRCPSVKEIEELGSYAASGALLEYTNEQFKQRYITQHFTIGFECSLTNQSSKRGTIYWMNEEFANFWFCDTENGAKEFGAANNNKWIFNRGSPCIALNWYDSKHQYDSLKEMLIALENSFPHSDYEKYLQGWPVKTTNGEIVQKKK